MRTLKSYFQSKSPSGYSQTLLSVKIRKTLKSYKKIPFKCIISRHNTLEKIQKKDPSRILRKTSRTINVIVHTMHHAMIPITFAFSGPFFLQFPLSPCFLHP